MFQDEDHSDGSDAVIRRQLYDAYFKDARAQQVASQQSYDKAILLYSSGGLALSITFLKDLVGGTKNAVNLGLLQASWALFALAMLVTVLSFLTSAAAQEESMGDAKSYYLDGNECAWNRVSWRDVLLRYMNQVSGFSFIGGVCATVWFAIVNT